MHLRFGESESAFDYMLATREYINKHGIFCVNHPNGALTGTTQFGRVLHDIGTLSRKTRAVQSSYQVII